MYRNEQIALFFSEYDEKPELDTVVLYFRVYKMSRPWLFSAAFMVNLFSFIHVLLYSNSFFFDCIFIYFYLFILVGFVIITVAFIYCYWFFVISHQFWIDHHHQQLETCDIWHTNTRTSIVLCLFLLLLSTFLASILFEWKARKKKKIEKQMDFNRYGTDVK